jgi:hypothetical protein
MSFILFGIALFLNVYLVLRKFKSNRTFDATLDALLLVAVIVFFKGSTELLLVGTVGSMLISLYLTVFPFKVSHANA